MLVKRSCTWKVVEMGAPAGHPFFGNQYTNGGYVNGSFSYAGLLDDVVRAAAETAAPLRKSMRGGSAPRLSKGVPPTAKPSITIPSLVAAGAVTLIGGIAAFVYLRSRSNGAEQALDGEEIAGFGLCESCGQVLASSGPAEVQRDEEGDFVVCENCSHKNRARYEDGQD